MMNIQGRLINPPGVVTITPDDAEVGTELTASLTDDDGGVTNVRWQWSRSNDGETGWTNISGARMASYKPVYATGESISELPPLTTTTTDLARPLPASSRGHRHSL